MGLPTTDQLYWIIEPLVEAGLTRDEIESLLFRLGFETIVGNGASVTYVSDLVTDQPAGVQAAWLHAVGRMIAEQPTADGS